jgi:sugar phosphate permease
MGTLGMLATAPGQTVGVSVFTDSLIDEFGITRSALSLAYLLGTAASALLLAHAGRLYDHFGGRLLGAAAGASLALVLVALTWAPTVADMLGGTWTPFLVITVGFFLLRFSGQGMLGLSSRNMVMEWFDQRRGFANAIMGVAIAFGLSYAPRVFDALIEEIGWRSAWRVIALAVAAFAALALVFSRDTPEAHGMAPDGPLRRERRRGHREAATGRPFTLSEARRTYGFWIFALSLTMTGLVMTAYTFHIVSIFGEGGMDRSRAVGVFLPAAVVAVIVEIVGSNLSDYVRLKYLLAFQLAGLVLLSLSVAMLRPGVVVATAIVGQGIMHGVFGVLSSVTWPRFFGRRHLGAISGFAMAIMVGGTAIGPYLFSLGRDLTDGYAAPALLCGGVGLVLLVGAAKADRPQ